MQLIDKTYGDFVGMDMWNAQSPLSEDCLYLNIWVPRAATTAIGSSNSTNKAVMVHTLLTRLFLVDTLDQCTFGVYFYAEMLVFYVKLLQHMSDRWLNIVVQYGSQ